MLGPSPSASAAAIASRLASVPFVIWGLESSWESGRWRGAVLGGLALACQVFAGHLQDALLTICLVGLYGLYRAATERALKARVSALGMAVALVGVGVLLSAVQWVPSMELLDRSPRAGGLSWDSLTLGSWHPELLPTLVVREAYGTRARSVMTDNGSAYRSVVHALACRALGLKHLRTRPYRPQTNGKAEHFIRTLLGGWAYGAIYGSSAERHAALPGLLDYSNHQRPHGSLSHQTPMTRLQTVMNNVPGSYT